MGYFRMGYFASVEEVKRGGEQALLGSSLLHQCGQYHESGGWLTPQLCLPPPGPNIAFALLCSGLVSH